MWYAFLPPSTPGRKRMPRTVRVFAPNTLYHVYCRVARGEKVFEDEHLAGFFVSTVREVSQCDGVTVLAWCLMSNHYHLVLRTGEWPLARSMALIQGRIARRHNCARGVLGRLWQSRYKAKVVSRDVYFQQLISYVHLNPVAAGLVDNPAAYPWSGHRELVGMAPPLLIDPWRTLSWFADDRETAIACYLGRLRLASLQRLGHEAVRDLPWWRSVPDNEAFAAARESDEVDRGQAEGSLPRVLRRQKSADEFLLRFAEAMKVAPALLCGRSRSQTAAHLRQVFVFVAAEQLGLPVKEIARVLAKNPGSASRILATARDPARPNDHLRISMGTFWANQPFQRPSTETVAHDVTW